MLLSWIQLADIEHMSLRKLFGHRNIFDVIVGGAKRAQLHDDVFLTTKQTKLSALATESKLTNSIGRIARNLSMIFTQRLPYHSQVERVQGQQ